MAPKAKSSHVSPRRDRTTNGKRAKRSKFVTPGSRNYVVLAPKGRGRSIRSRAGGAGSVVIEGHGVTIIGAAQSIEDFLDGQEINRRLADTESRRRVSWAALKARRGL